MKLRTLMGLLAFAISAVNCATTNNKAGTPTTYTETADRNFELAKKALADKRFDEAIAHFEFIRNKYPYSHHAADSDLMIADAHFAQEKWLEASDAYDFFIRFHPVHEQVSYAYFNKAKANVNAMPTDFFLFPKAYTKDQKSTNEALASIEQFLQQFPKDENVLEAQKMRTMLRDKIAQKNLYVARFYAERKKWKGANLRYEEVVNTYADTPSASQAFLELAVIKKKYLDESEESKKLLTRVINEFPDSAEAKSASDMLKEYL